MGTQQARHRNVVMAHAQDGGHFSLILSKHESRESSVDITIPFLAYFPISSSPRRPDRYWGPLNLISNAGG
jgi:hypothetical protein